MKQNKLNFILKFIIINFVISGLMTFAVLNLTSERYVKDLVFEINMRSTALEFITRNYNFRVNENPTVYLRKLDRDLRKRSTNLSCANLAKIKKVLPVSFALVDDRISIQITSRNEEEVVECSKLIVERITEYNQIIRDKFLKDFLFELNMKKLNKESNSIDIMNSINKQVNTILEEELLIESIVKTEKETIENILNLLAIIDLQTRLNYNDISMQEQKFSEVLNKIVIITLQKESMKLSKPPSEIMIFIATFAIFTFIYLIFINFKLSRKQMLKYFKKISPIYNH
jgi:hypothetical protein